MISSPRAQRGGSQSLLLAITHCYAMVVERIYNKIYSVAAGVTLNHITISLNDNISILNVFNSMCYFVISWYQGTCIHAVAI